MTTLMVQERGASATCINIITFLKWFSSIFLHTYSKSLVYVIVDFKSDFPQSGSNSQCNINEKTLLILLLAIYEPK